MRQSVWRRALRVGGVLLAMGFVVPPTAASAQRRVALVIGNAAYDAPSARLINPVNDARAMSAMLQDLDFEVTEATDANREQMDDAAAMFIGEVRPGDVALFYYAGHGMEIDGMNYLAPVEANPGWTRSLRRRTLAARNGSPAHALSSVSGRLRRSAGRGGFSVVGEQRAKFGPRGPHGPPETAVRVDLPPWRAAFPASYAAISTCRRLTFNARHTRSHSQRTFASPRKLKRRKPSACLIQP